MEGNNKQPHQGIHNKHHITPIGVTNWRNQNIPFGIKDTDRLHHIYVIGKSGTGKSTLLINMALSDIQKGKGLAVIDPHGDVSKTLIQNIPEHRKHDLIYFNPTNTENPVSFNPIHGIHPNYHHLVSSGLLSTFKKIWKESWGPRLEHILRYSLLTLLCYPNATLLDIQPLLTESAFRDKVLDYVANPHIITFWKNEYEAYSSRQRSEYIAPILNKVGIFRASTPLRNILGQPTRGIRISQVMDTSKIFIANLSKGTIGEDASAILGSILVTSFQLNALYRSSIPEHKRVPFYLYIDECHSFITDSIADILAEARKYKLSLFLAHQYIEQLSEPIRAAIFGNVGTMISFRVGATDAQYLAKEFYPIFNEMDLINLPRYHIYLKLCIDGEMSMGFSGITAQNILAV